MVRGKWIQARAQTKTVNVNAIFNADARCEHGLILISLRYTWIPHTNRFITNVTFRHVFYWALFDTSIAMMNPVIIMLLLATLSPSNQATDEGVNLEQRLIQMQMDFQGKIEAEYQVVFIADCFVTLMSWFYIYVYIYKT